MDRIVTWAGAWTANKQGIRGSLFSENWHINHFNASDYDAILFYAF
jgi:hypothetical protein